MEKETFLNILKENKPEKMMEFLLSNGKKPKPFNPFRTLTDEEIEQMEERKNGSEYERIDGRN